MFSLLNPTKFISRLSLARKPKTPPMVIWLASFPRSGNTLFRIVVNHCYGLTVHALNDVTRQPTLASLLGTDDRGRTPEQLEREAELSLLKTHRLPSDNRPAVCLVRDGRDALVSYAHYVQAADIDSAGQKPFLEVLREKIVEEHPAWGSWSQSVLSWGRRSPTAPTAWVKFEDLIRDPARSVGEALRQIGVHRELIDDKPLPTFAELQDIHPPFFRKGQVGAWREEMPEDLHNLFWERHSAAMERFGYPEDRPTNFNAMCRVA